MLPRRLKLALRPPAPAAAADGAKGGPLILAPFPPGTPRKLPAVCWTLKLWAVLISRSRAPVSHCRTASKASASASLRLSRTRVEDTAAAPSSDKGTTCENTGCKIADKRRRETG